MNESEDVRIRPARIQDLDALLTLEALFPSDRMSRRSLRRFIESPSASVLVAESQDRVLGNLVLLTRKDSRLARIYSVIVDPQSRGLGLGRRLVEKAIELARTRGSKRLALEVRADNAPARALYARLGFNLAATLPRYYDDGADGIRLTLHL